MKLRERIVPALVVASGGLLVTFLLATIDGNWQGSLSWTTGTPALLGLFFCIFILTLWKPGRPASPGQEGFGADPYRVPQNSVHGESGDTPHTAAPSNRASLARIIFIALSLVLLAMVIPSIVLAYLLRGPG